mmetsp:Transcript_1468/g.2032  ORF Transcript_1468/g.2032 Transcript_1468/m.2032 type:complete len:248 (-) Transcript_1468:248-991(-)
MQAVLEQIRVKAGTNHELAPYQSTPAEAVESFVRFSEVGLKDCVVEVGCGDGRLLLAAANKVVEDNISASASDPEAADWAVRSGLPRFVGFEVDPLAVQDATRNLQQMEQSWQERGVGGWTHPVNGPPLVEIRGEDVLKADFDWSKVTVVFLYLTKLGLAKFWPFLLEQLSGQQKSGQAEDGKEHLEIDQSEFISSAGCSTIGPRILSVQFPIQAAGQPERTSMTSYIDTRGVQQEFTFFSYRIPVK